jgi:UDP-N-acetyl-D-glucosamine/UDP-N-acetyl-D-galactosamine dehydrogenase
MSNIGRIIVVGLGYVGLPVAVALARKFDVTGFDIDSARIAELRGGHDRTREIHEAVLTASTLGLTESPADCRGADIYIVTVPTPVDDANQPDLTAVVSATRMIAGVIDPARRPTIIYESTVYPGVTEEICGGELDKAGFQRGRDFRLGYSPERINPGDRTHTVDKITKVIAGEDHEVLEQMAELYGSITSGGVFRAASIKAAEAAKAIENAQRDINIAFMNEVAQILSKIHVSVWDVLAAARTKWNFLPFEPGLVGGHCIGVDPYYLSHLAQELGHDPHVILSGRKTNDDMGRWIADSLHQRLGGKTGRVLVLGLTFKEDVPDLRNSRAFDLVSRLRELGHSVDVADPLADPAELQRDHQLSVVEPGAARYALVIGAVAHAQYRAFSAGELEALLDEGGILADPKGMWRDRQLNGSIVRWSL